MKQGTRRREGGCSQAAREEFNVKASPMPTFYHERPPPKVKLKKNRLSYSVNPPSLHFQSSSIQICESRILVQFFQRW